VRVSGTKADGKEFNEVYDTTWEGDAGPWRALVIEVAGGDLQATSSAPFMGFAPADQRPITDVHARAAFTDATGTISHNDGAGDDAYAGSSVKLDGPLSLRLDKVAGGRLTYTLSDGLQLGALADTPEKDKPSPPAALAAAGAAGAGGAGLLIALAYFWPRLKFAWMVAFLPMYTRIERDAVLEHDKRDELYELIRGAPGIHAHEIGEKAHIGWGTTVYHLKLLENHGLIVSKKTGRYKRFFVNTGEYTKKKDLYGALRNETAKAVADHIVNHPGTTQKEMCAALSIQPSLASWHVEKLESVELVKRVKDGRMVRYFAGPAWSELNVRVDPVGGADAPAET
jgi:DNA-binding transcriptional ArsR family regulator